MGDNVGWPMTLSEEKLFGRAEKAEAELAAACADLATLRRAASAYRDAIGRISPGLHEHVPNELGALNVALRGERREGERRYGGVRGGGPHGRRMKADRRI